MAQTQTDADESLTGTYAVEQTTGGVGGLPASIQRVRISENPNPGYYSIEYLDESGESVFRQDESEPPCSRSESRVRSTLEPNGKYTIVVAE